MKYPTVLRWCTELPEKTPVRSAGGSGSANQNHSTSLARDISYRAEAERLSLLMPPGLLDPPFLLHRPPPVSKPPLSPLPFFFFLSMLFLSTSPFSHLFHFIFFQLLVTHW